MTTQAAQPADEAIESFIGRTREMELLRRGLDDAVAGRGRSILVVGDAGIGKTRLVAEFAAEARDRGALVLWGRCWEDSGAPAYWPWLQLVRSFVRQGDGDGLNAALGPAASPLVALVPELAQRRPDLLPATSAGSDDSEATRFQLFDAVTTFFANLRLRRPLVLVFDDLHAADPASLQLLQFLTRQLSALGVLVVSTLRDGEPSAPDWFPTAMAQLRRDAVRIDLRGLDAADAGRFAAQVAGTKPSAAVLDAVYQLTEGNPFFIDELVRLLVAEGHLATLPDAISLSLPQAVRDVVHRRLAPLSEPTRQLLQLAAALGRDIVLAQVQAVTGLPLEDLYRQLEEAVEHGSVVAPPQPSLPYTFAHPLVREVLYGEIALSDRAELHHRIALALGRLYGHDDAPHLGALAHHFLAALPRGEVGTALEYALRAARSAHRQAAYEEAARWCERGLSLWNLQQPPEVMRCELLLTQAEAERRAGDTAAARAHFGEAADRAAAQRNPALAARAAIGFSSSGAETGAVDESLVRRLERALALLPAADAPLRATVLAHLAMALYFSERSERRTQAASEAVAMARRTGDAPALAVALLAQHFTLWRAGTAPQRLAISAELIELADRLAIADTSLEARDWRIVDLLECGDMHAARAEAESYARLAHELRFPRHVRQGHLLHANFALFDGRYAEAEAAALRAFELGKHVHAPNAAQFLGVQIFTLRREQGRLSELQDLVARFTNQFPGLPIWRCGAAFLAAETGQREAAQRELTALAGDDFAILRHDGNWMASVALLAEVSAAVDDASSAAKLHALLEPFADRSAGRGPLVVVATGVACFAPVAYYLGLTAATCRRWPSAFAWFDDAAATCVRLNTQPWLAYTRLAQARARFTCTGGSDDERGLSYLRECRQVADELGMVALQHKTAALQASLNPPAAAVAPTRAAGAPDCFLREGDYWTIVFDGRTARLRDSKGLRYLHVLLRRAGDEVFTPDLIAEAEPGALAASSGDAGPRLDTRARAAYKERLHELTDDLEDARRCNDLGRAERAQAEIDRLARELSAAVGLGGRERRAGSAAERARVSVTKAIAAALKNIALHHPSLAQHLDRHVRTGTFCRYATDPHDAVAWSLWANPEAPPGNSLV